MQPLVSIITVNYNGAKLTEALLLSLQKISYSNVEVIVVDNNSSEGIDNLKAAFKEVIFIDAPENLGFAGGNNLGFNNAKGKYFLMLNNDTEVEPDFLEPLVEVMESDERIGCTSSKLIYFEDKKTIQFAGHSGINLYSGRGFTRGYHEMNTGQYEDVIDIQIAHGAAMMVSRKMVEEVGLMADLYFLYYEEVDYCHRIIDAGYTMKYVGPSTVYHKESQTVGRESTLKVYYMSRNRWIYMRRNAKGIQALIGWLYFLLVAFPKNLLKYVLKRKPELLKAYWTGSLWNLTHNNIYENPTLERSNV